MDLQEKCVLKRPLLSKAQSVSIFFLQLILLQNSLGNIGCSLLAGSHVRRRVMVSISYYLFFFFIFFLIIFIEIEIARKIFSKINLKFSFEDLNK